MRFWKGEHLWLHWNTQLLPNDQIASFVFCGSEGEANRAKLGGFMCKLGFSKFYVSWGERCRSDGIVRVSESGWAWDIHHELWALSGNRQGTGEDMMDEGLSIILCNGQKGRCREVACSVWRPVTWGGMAVRDSRACLISWVCSSAVSGSAEFWDPPNMEEFLPSEAKVPVVDSRAELRARRLVDRFIFTGMQRWILKLLALESVIFTVSQWSEFALAKPEK